MAITAAPKATSNGVLDTLLNTGLGVFQSITNKDIAKLEAKTQLQASENAARTAAANSSAMSNVTKIALVAGAVLVGLVVVIAIFKR